MWPAQKVWEVCLGMEVEGNFMGGVPWYGGGGNLHALMWTFSRQQKVPVACSQCVSDSVYTARIVLLFSAKMMELEQQYFIKFCQKIGNSQV